MCMFALPLQAHEFWIEPEDYTVEAGDILSATLRNGEEFAGSTISYIPARFQRFEIVTDGGAQPVEGRIGDNPAVAVGDLPEGLATILHETSDQSLTYREWAKFLRFVDHKAFDGVPEAHLARGLSQESFREAYRRFAKALVAVGDGAGQDRRHGFRIEIVLGANPYTDDLGGRLPVQVWLDDAPRAGAQIEVFEKSAEGDVVITLHIADNEGRVVLPVKAGHAYLLDSVAIEPLEPESERDPVWKTLWAALTFAVPEA